jgi:hypothetical protein
MVTAAAVGALRLLALSGVPNPDPHSLALQLESPADAAVISLWTPALTLLGRWRCGPLGAGWQQVALPPGILAGAPDGILYVTVQLERGAKRSAPIKPLRLYKTR